MEVIDIRLINSKYRANLDYDKAEDDTYNIDTVLGYQADFDEDERIVTSIIKLRSEGKNIPYEFEVEFGGKFRLEEGEEMTDEVIDRVCKINCPAIIFPYLREFIADLSRRGGFKPMHLDPVNFINLAENMEKVENK
jgi:preprotein translocase subunit SecB